MFFFSVTQLNVSLATRHFDIVIFQFFIRVYGIGA